MVNEDLDNDVNIKENLDGLEDIRDVFFFPQERVRHRVKNTKTYTQDMVSDNGLHFDRDLNTSDNVPLIHLPFDNNLTNYGSSSITASVVGGSEDYATGNQFDYGFNFVGSGTPKKTTGAYIDLSSNVEVDSQNHTVAFWYKTSESYFQNICTQEIDNTSGSIELRPASNELNIESVTNNHWDECLDTDIDIDDGEWHHYCIVFSDTDTKLYVDNNLPHTETANSDPLGYFRYNIIGGYGNTEYTYGECPTGVMGDFRVYEDKQLDATEVNALYNEGFGQRYDYLGFWNNPDRQFDADPVDANPVLQSITSPGNTLIEDFRVTDDIDTVNTTADIQTTNRKAVLDDEEIIITNQITLHPTKYIKDINITLSNADLDLFIKWDGSWIEIDKSYLLDNELSHDFYVKVENNTGSQQELDKMIINYSYW